jgi:hypothetical protein
MADIKRGRTENVERDANGKPLFDDNDIKLPQDIIDEIPAGAYCVDVGSILFYYILDRKKFFQWRNLPDNPYYSSFKIRNPKPSYRGRTENVERDENGKPLFDIYDEKLPSDIIKEIPAGAFGVTVRRHLYEYYIGNTLHSGWRNLTDDPFCEKNRQDARKP